MTPTEDAADARPGTPPETAEVAVRPAGEDDLLAVAALHVKVRAAAYPVMPALVHSPAAVTAWVRGWDLTRREVWVAESAGRLVGYAAVTEAWLDDLYVDPERAGQGIGAMLLDLVKARRPDGLGLWVFASNLPARRFYLARGFVEVERTDGSGNEERQPDVRMAWPGPEDG